MIFAQAIGAEQVAQGFGWQAAVVIVPLAIAVVVEARIIYNLMQQRLSDAKEAQKDIVEPLRSVAKSQKKIIDLLEEPHNGRTNTKRGA